MHEDILAILARQKAKTFGGIEPLYCSCFFHIVLVSKMFCSDGSPDAIEVAYDGMYLIEGFKRGTGFQKLPESSM
jgi:hypothetical protein